MTNIGNVIFCKVIAIQQQYYKLIFPSGVWKNNLVEKTVNFQCLCSMLIIPATGAVIAKCVEWILRLLLLLLVVTLRPVHLNLQNLSMLHKEMRK